MGRPIGYVVPPEERFEDFMFPVTETGCWLYSGCWSTTGYGSFGISHGKSVNAHRYAYELYVGSVPEGFYVTHKCDTRPCCNPEHLCIGTPSENQFDRYNRRPGNVPMGETHYKSKLTDAQVREIRASNEGATALGRKYGVGRRYIYELKKNQYRLFA